MKFQLVVIFLLFINFLCMAEVTFNEQVVVPDTWNGRHTGDYWLADTDGDGADELFVCYRPTYYLQSDWYLVQYSLEGDTLSVTSEIINEDAVVSKCRMYITEDTIYLIVVYNREHYDQEVCDLKVYDFATMDLIDSHSNYEFFTEFGNVFDTNYIELAEDNDTTYLYLGLTYGYDTYMTRQEFYTSKMVKYTFDDGYLDFEEEVEECGKDMIFCSATEPLITMGFNMASTYRNTRGSYTNTINIVYHDYPTTVEEILNFTSTGPPRVRNLTQNDHHYQDYGMIIFENTNHQYHCYSPDLSEIIWEDDQEGIGDFGLEAFTCINAQEGDHFIMNFYDLYSVDYLEIRDRINGDVLLTQEVDFMPYNIIEGSFGDLYFMYYEDDFLYYYTLADEINLSNDSNEITAYNYNLSNSPNPFNPTTYISYSIPSDSKVNIIIYNIKGQKIKTLVSEQITQGDHSVIWEGKNDNGLPVSSGVYFYSLIIDGIKKADNKCLLLK